MHSSSKKSVCVLCMHCMGFHKIVPHRDLYSLALALHMILNNFYNVFANIIVLLK
jgi:hypothetical protein